jgi:amino acid permease
LAQSKKIETWKSKLFITAIFLVTICFTVNGSAFSFLSIPSTVFLLTIIVSMIGHNSYLQIFSHHTSQITQDLVNWDIDHTFLYLGITMYSFSGIGSIFTIRNSMLAPKSLPKISNITYVCIAIIFLILGASFYSVYGNENQQPVAFDYYPNHSNYYFLV